MAVRADCGRTVSEVERAMVSSSISPGGFSPGIMRLAAAAVAAVGIAASLGLGQALRDTAAAAWLTPGIAATPWGVLGTLLLPLLLLPRKPRQRKPLRPKRLQPLRKLERQRSDVGV